MVEQGEHDGDVRRCAALCGGPDVVAAGPAAGHLRCGADAVRAPPHNLLMSVLVIHSQHVYSAVCNNVCDDDDKKALTFKMVRSRTLRSGPALMLTQNSVKKSKGTADVERRGARRSAMHAIIQRFHLLLLRLSVDQLGPDLIRASPMALVT